MTEEEMKAEIAKQISALTKTHNDEIAGLKAKNSELLALQKSAKEAAETAEAEKEAQEEAAARANNDLAAIEAKLTAKYEREIAKLKTENESSQAQLTTLLIDNAISGSLDEHKAMPQFKKAVTAMIKAEAKLEKGEAFAGGIALKDYIADFAASEDGAPFFAAPANGGAAVTNQTNATAAVHTFTKENFASREIEWAALAGTNPTLAKSIAESVGRSDLAQTL